MNHATKQIPGRIYLSPPQLNGRERSYIDKALQSGWISTVGPQVEAFEQALADRVGVKYAVGLASGTAGLHLAVRALGVRRGDEVICSTFTFAASANPIVYEGGRPVFIDSDRSTWNMDVDLLQQELKRSARRGSLPRAVIAVDLYGQCADLGAIKAACERYEVPLIEDAAEALGASYKGRSAGSFGWANIFSFNGNKIITSSGGGMLATNDGKLAQTTRMLAAQARDPASHYQHSAIGYNYRLSNILAAIGLAQLELLDECVAARRRIFESYRKELGGVDGIEFMPEASYGRSTRWLTCVLIDSRRFGASREEVRIHLESKNIESRPVWKPMHRQPVFAGCRIVGGPVSEDLFVRGLCLPSGSSLAAVDIRRIALEMLAARR